MSSLFGLNEFNHLVHVSEVERGLACQCRCVVCTETLVARQGNVRGHHFAHASNREPCDSNHESLLHRYAKQLIVDSGGLVVPMTFAVAHCLGLEAPDATHTLRATGSVEEEVWLGAIRPDLMLTTDDGVQIAIEIAYSSFCDLTKMAAFEEHKLPALEIDLSRFTPENFDPEAVRLAVVESISQKIWIWPTAEPQTIALPPAPEPIPPVAPKAKQTLPEEIITIAGRWVSVKEFPSGDIAVKVVAFDPDVVSLVRTIAKSHGARYNPQYKTWNVPRWAAQMVRCQLRDKAESFRICFGVAGAAP
ncbi:MAG: competence protein CoiA family protein [Polaromonas sp.]